MARRVTHHLMGLQNYSKNPYRRNTLQPDIWHRVLAEDGRVLQPESKAQKVPHRRSHPTKGDTCNEGSSIRQVRANIG